VSADSISVTLHMFSGVVRLKDRKSADMCIFTPAYNECKRIESTIERQAKELERWATQLVFD